MNFVNFLKVLFFIENLRVVASDALLRLSNVWILLILSFASLTKPKFLDGFFLKATACTANEYVYVIT